MLLIVGSKGFLGRHLVSCLLDMGERFLTGSHQAGADIHLNLRRPVTGLDLPTGITHAIVCSSVTSIDACHRDPEGSRKVNVTHTIGLLKSLQERGILPVFTSSDLVFRGDSGNYREDDLRLPTTEYGRQKRDVEDFLLSRTEPCLIVRMSKLYSVEPNDPSPVGQIVRTLARREPVSCAVDQVISPTNVADITTALHQLIKTGLTGVYHVSSPERYTRYTLGISIARQLGVTHLVKPCSIGDFAFAEPRPRDNSLDVSKFLSEVGFKFISLDTSLHRITQKDGSRKPS